MQRHRRLWIALAGLSLFALLLAGALSFYSAQAHADGNPQDGTPDRTVVEHYFTILNDGMVSGDFSALATVYAPDATLNQSTPTGHTNVYQGITAIIKWYEDFRVPPRIGMQFTQDPNHPLRNLAPHVLIAYEIAGPVGWSVPGRCMHVFTLKGGMIQTLDWATFYGGAM